MSEQTEKAAKPDPKHSPHPRDLSSEYHKAHKQLMLWSAILFIWEFVGIDLEKAGDAGGNVGPVIKALKSPQAVPWALLLLVLYFLLKCCIEWAQCYPERRRLLFARIDFISALLVSGAAIALYIGQAISRVQFANALNSRSALLSLVIGISCGMGWVIFGIGLFREILSPYSIDKEGVAFISLFGLLGLGSLIGIFVNGRDWRFVVLGILIGSILSIISQPYSSRKVFQAIKQKLNLPKK